MIPVVQEIRESSAGVEVQNDYVEPQFKAMNVYDADAMYDAYMEIVEYDAKNNTRLAKDTLYATLLQAGTMNTPFSFLDKIPGDIFAALTSDIFEYMETDSDAARLNAEVLLEEFHKNMINDNNAVQYVQPKSRKKGRLMFTREKDSKRVTTRMVGEARQKFKYILTRNANNDIISTVGYGSRNYLNTTTKRMSFRREIEVPTNDPTDTENC